MSTTTIRVSSHTHALLHDLAHKKGTSMQAIVEQALDLYRREQILQAANDAYATLRTDATAWHDYQQELTEWDETLSDGLEEE